MCYGPRAPEEKNFASGFSNDLHIFAVVREKKKLALLFKSIEV
jgi:hypothetical protein